MKMRIFLLAGSVLLTGLGRAEGQSTGQVYHVVREAMFTNAAACGYLDGLRAGNNFLCGVYAGTVSNALKPCFAWAHGSLVAPVRSNGVTFFHGYPVINATPGTPLR